MNPQRTFSPGQTASPRRPNPEKLREEKAKARALQRWENEGGKVLRAPKSTEDDRKKPSR